MRERQQKLHVTKPPSLRQDFTLASFPAFIKDGRRWEKRWLMFFEIERNSTQNLHVSESQISWCKHSDCQSNNWVTTLWSSDRRRRVLSPGVLSFCKVDHVSTSQKRSRNRFVVFNQPAVQHRVQQDSSSDTLVHRYKRRSLSSAIEEPSTSWKSLCQCSSCLV